MSTRIELRENKKPEISRGLMRNHCGAVIFVTEDGDKILLVSAIGDKELPSVEKNIILDNYREFSGSVTIFSD